jgi:TPR repeat protein
MYQQAASKNVVAAELRLGELYLHGNKVLPNADFAKSNLERAAYRGEPRAAMLLGQMYEDDIGTTAAPVKAYAWSEVATIEGDKLAKQERNASRRQLDVKDQVAAVQRAKDILAKVAKGKIPRSSRPKAARAGPSNPVTSKSTRSAATLSLLT